MAVARTERASMTACAGRDLRIFRTEVVLRMSKLARERGFLVMSAIRFVRILAGHAVLRTQPDTLVLPDLDN
jgi:hypothetical protein